MLESTREITALHRKTAKSERYVDFRKGSGGKTAYLYARPAIQPIEDPPLLRHDQSTKRLADP